LIDRNAIDLQRDRSLEFSYYRQATAAVGYPANLHTMFHLLMTANIL